jgi:hypothetical protein
MKENLKLTVAVLLLSIFVFIALRNNSNSSPNLNLCELKNVNSSVFLDGECYFSDSFQEATKVSI